MSGRARATEDIVWSRVVERGAQLAVDAVESRAVRGLREEWRLCSYLEIDSHFVVARRKCEISRDLETPFNLVLSSRKVPDGIKSCCSTLQLSFKTPD